QAAFVPVEMSFSGSPARRFSSKTSSLHVRGSSNAMWPSSQETEPVVCQCPVRDNAPATTRLGQRLGHIFQFELLAFAQRVSVDVHAHRTHLVIACRHDDINHAALA